MKEEEKNITEIKIERKGCVGKQNELKFVHLSIGFYLFIVCVIVVFLISGVLKKTNNSTTKTQCAPQTLTVFFGKLGIYLTRRLFLLLLLLLHFYSPSNTVTLMHVVYGTGKCFSSRMDLRVSRVTR